MADISFLRDSAGDWSSSRLVALVLGIVVVAMAVVLCVVALRDSANSAPIVTAIAASLVPLGAGIVGALWRRSE